MNYLYKKISFVLICLFFILFSSFASGKRDKLFNTIENGSVKEVKSLLRNNKELVNITRGAEKENLLMAALREDRELEVIKILLNYGADQDKKDKQKRTSLMYASKYSSKPEVVEKIIKSNSFFGFTRKNRVLKQDKNGKNSFDYARENSHSEAIISVLNKYAQEVQNKDNQPSAETNEEITEQEEMVESNSALAPQELPKPYEQPLQSENAVLPPPSSVNLVPVQVLSKEFDETKDEEKNKETSELIPSSKDEADTILQEETSVTENIIPQDESNTQTDDLQLTASPQENIENKHNTESEDLRVEVLANKELESVSQPIPEVNQFKKTYLFDYAQLDEDEIEVTEEKESDLYHTYIENANRKDLNGRTKLMLAAKNGDLQTVENLIFSNAELDVKDNDGWTALMFAARFSENEKIIKTLIKNGATVTLKNNYGITALKLAAGFTNNTAVLSELLSNYKESENEVRASFIYAITSNASTQILELFYKKGLPLNASYDGKTPLMYACESNKDTKIIKWLLDNGAKTNYRTSGGITAFDLAKENKNLPHDKIYWSLNSSAGETR